MATYEEQNYLGGGGFNEMNPNQQVGMPPQEGYGQGGIITNSYGNNPYYNAEMQQGGQYNTTNYNQQQTPANNPVTDANINPETGLPPTQNYDNSPISGSNPYSPWTSYGNPNSQNNSYGSDWNGNQTAGAMASPADYEGVQDFSDAAYDNARRYLDPQQSFDNRRFDQELINRGIDPMSDYGKQMYEEMMRAHGDQDQGAAYGAMQFGQGIQEQMFRQNYDNTRQAGDMQRAQWQDQSNRYATDAGYKVGMGNLELGRQQQDFNEMGYYDSRDYRNQLYNDSRNDRYQNIAMWMAGMENPSAGLDSNSNLTQGSPWAGYIEDMNDLWRK